MCPIYLQYQPVKAIPLHLSVNQDLFANGRTGCDEIVAETKWKIHIAIRKHNRNILLHIGVKSYGTPGSFIAAQKQTCSLCCLLTLTLVGGAH